MEISKKEDVVTCFYCEHHDLPYINETEDIFKKNKGICSFKNIIRYSSDSICNSFVLKSGFYTKKWYPGKKE